MATYCTSAPKIQRNFKGFATALKSAACEWFLIFLLFIDAALSYLLTRFAHYCELQIPCILCSRLDHVFGNEKPGFYRNLLCSNHRSEISSLISCNIHGKLVDGRGMCENCLSSHIEENKSNSDLQSLVLGKLGFDLAGHGDCSSRSSLFKRDLNPASKGKKLCLCCNKPWIPRPNSQRLLYVKSSGIAVGKPNIPLPRRLSRRNGLKRMRDKFSAPAASHLLAQAGSDPLSHVGYTELKITSESESEVPFSDDETANSIVHNINESKRELLVNSAPETPCRRLSDDLATPEWPDAKEPRDVRCLTPDIPCEDDVCERKEQPSDQKHNTPVLPELISLDDSPPSPCFVEVPSFSASLLSDLISLVDAPLSVDNTQVPLESSEKYVTEASKTEKISVNKNDETLKVISTSTGASLKTDQVEDDTAVVNSTNEDLSAVHILPACSEEKDLSAVHILPACSEEKDLSAVHILPACSEEKDLSAVHILPACSEEKDLSAVHILPACSEEKDASGFVTKEPTVTYNNGIDEDVKSLPAQNSTIQGIQLSLNTLSPRFRDRSFELQRSSESNSNKAHERSESACLESFDPSSINEIEGESLVERLKQQVEHDQKCINALYKELEEERNASETATNEAMAMITRLQEEKAALHMEALQYLRMMEEQAEYDGDALEKANDLLTEKEKEVQDLEAELEYYRLNFPDETVGETVPEASINIKNVSLENTSASSIKDDPKFPSKTMYPASEVNANPVDISSWAEFEDEKLYISQCLQSLERKVNRFAHRGTSPYVSDSEYCDEAADRGQNHQERLHRSISRHQLVSQRNGCMVSNGQKGSVGCGEIDLASLENEISDLNERLEALEADSNFLEHSLNSLQNGNEGLPFILEILHQLRELRKLGIRK